MIDNSTDFLNALNGQEGKEIWRLGTVTGMSNGDALIRFFGEETESEKAYGVLSSYTPVKDDKVLLAKIQNTYVVLGKIKKFV